MEIQQLDVLLRLIIAHLLADFVFQTNAIAESKKYRGLNSRNFYLHLLLVGALTWILLARLDLWYAVLALTGIHGLIDQLKYMLKKDTIAIFLADQFFHFLSLVFIWLWITDNSLKDLLPVFLTTQSPTPKLLLYSIAFILVTLPSGVLVGYLTRPWHKDIQSEGAESLQNAGKWIGILERFLILLFVIVNQWAAIGFLLAAKSVFRFGDLREGADQKKTEYILIGTLISLSIAIVTGLALKLIVC